MKLFTSSQIKEIDAYTIKNEPISSISLIERVANSLYSQIVHYCKPFHKLAIIAGKGNNGSDAIALFCLMKKTGYNCSLFAFSKDECKVESKYFLEKAGNISPLETFLDENNFDVIIDGLFGTGISRPVEGLMKEIINHINNLPATVISIDIPSGINADLSISNNTTIVKANITLTLEFSKLSFMLPEYGNYTGELKIIPISLHNNIKETIFTPYFEIEAQNINIKKRDAFSHKGTYGHSIIIGGSKGKAGACILATQAALKIGSGLVTSVIPNCCNDIIQITIPEAMTKTSIGNDYITYLPDVTFANAICIGPGLGVMPETQTSIIRFISDTKIPLVIDADALNIIAKTNSLKLIPKNSIITPHPKEFDRLFGNCENFAQRIERQLFHAQDLEIYIILKGHRTSIATPDGNLYFNSTGNPGMATAGSGDVLAGMITGMLAQGYSAKEAAINSVFIHGLAGDKAAEKLTEHCINARDIINNIPKALKSLLI